VRLDFLFNEGSIRNRCDGFSVLFRAEENIKSLGITMKTDVNIKREAELVKIQKFEDHFGNGFTAHGRSATCYAYRHGNDLCRDI
jgi:hypothetical protein